MKIIHLVLGKANPERMNGVNKVAYNLATTQTNLGYDVTLWGITANLTKNYPDRNFKTQLFQSIGSKFKVHPSIKEAIKKLTKDTIVHIHGAFITDFYHIIKLFSNQGINITYTPHGAYSSKAMEHNALIKKVYFYLLETTILKKIKVLHLLGKTESDNVKKLLPKYEKVAVIPNGQDLSAIPTLNIDKSNREAPIFGFLGRLRADYKGLDLLIEGFSIYLKNGGKGTLELIGGGDDMDMLKAMAAELNIMHKVTFHGPVYGDEKYTMTANFDVFLHTSRTEGFPTAVLEAAALKLPCLTSESTNINDYIRKYNAGYPYLENTPNGIAKELAKAAADFETGKLKAKGQNAYQMVVEEFTWESVSKQLIAVY